MTNVWPTQAGARKFYGAPGTNQVILQLPYRMTYDGKPVTRMMINAKCAKSAERALTQIAKEYNEADRLKLGLSIFGGCYNNRLMRGSKSRVSMHAFACAIDFDPARNQLKWGRDRARLAQADCEPFWRAWEEEGWTSLGRKYNYDWMHVEATSGR